MNRPSQSPPLPEELRLLSVQEVSALLGISQKATYAMIARGQLPVVRLGRRVRVRASDLVKIVESGLSLGCRDNGPKV